jgi:geranylgeranyl diphosphate synthase, type II
MRYSLLAGGKRIRPVLALATAEALGRPAAEVLPLAAAIEMIHTYSLIHDDLPAMDDDELRRGKPTRHVAFGEDVAILAGDGLFAEALRLALAEQQGEPANLIAALRELVTAAGTHGMVGGQFLDVAGAVETEARAGGAREHTFSLRHLHEMKTGALIAASVGSVLALEGLDGPPTMPFRRFAAELGVVFQIVDDILDVTGDEAELGKPRGSDERHGKATYVSAFGLDRARELARESHAAARSALAEADGATGRLGQIADYILTRTT